MIDAEEFLSLTSVFADTLGVGLMLLKDISFDARVDDG